MKTVAETKQSAVYRYAKPCVCFCVCVFSSFSRVGEKEREINATGNDSKWKRVKQSNE